MKKRIRYQPSKGNSIFGGIVGIIFCLIGLFLVIPTFGIFGLFWTAIAVFITARSFAMAQGKADAGSYIIEDESVEEKEGETVEERLAKLRVLYEQRLITTEEYEEKRKEILEEL